MAVRVKINRGAYNSFLSQVVQPYLVKQAREIAEEARKNAPVGTGELKSSIAVQKKGRGGAEIQVNAPHAAYVHEGTGPQHIPAPRNNYFPRLRRRGLILWSESKALNPYAVAHGVQAKGTPANPFLSEALEKVLGRYDFKWIRRDIVS